MFQFCVILVDPSTKELATASSNRHEHFDSAVEEAQAACAEPGGELVQILELHPQGKIHRLFCPCGAQYYRGLAIGPEHQH